MQNIQKLYQDLHEGKISKNQFLFQLRKDSRINSFFTSANSYDETVRILKNRGLLFEKHLTPAETKKKESIITSMKDTFKGPAPAMYAIATKKAEKLAEDNLDEDYEVSMAEDSLDSIIQAAMKLKSELGGQEVNLPAWVQDHITNSENYINQAAKGYHEADAEMANHAGEENESMYEARFKKGEDIGEKGMNFKKIQKDAAKRYGSEEAGKRVAGSILKKVLKKEEIGSNDPETSYEDGGTDENRDIIVTANDLYYYPKDKLVATFWHAYPGTGEHIFHQGDVVKPNDKYYKMILNSPALEEDSDYEFDEEENNSTSKNLPTAPSQEETDANQVYENDLNEAALSPKAVEYIKNYIDKFDERAMAVKLVDIALKSSAGVESSDLPDTSTFANGVDEIQSLLEDQEYNKAYQMAKETAQEMLDEEGFGNLNEAKEFTKGGDQVNPYELEKGTYYELDCQKDGAKDTKKAKAKAIKNLNKNPKYYSDLFSKNYDDKPNTSDQMQIVKESLKNLINDILSEK